MKKVTFKMHFFSCIIMMFFLLLFDAANANHYYKLQDDQPAVIGRWDITVNMDGKEYPSWLEIQLSGNSTLVGQFVSTGGSARPISKITFTNEEISFSIPIQWEKEGNDLSFNAKFEGDTLNGTMVSADGKNYKWSGVRAPSLHRNAEPVWQKPITLFDGHDLNGWHASGKNQWLAKDGIISSPASGSNLITDKTFNDFKLHIEFRYPHGSNSGVYLRGRYEVQIEDENGDEPYKDVFSAIYGFIAPSEMTAKGAGEWQSYDITLIGRLVTVAANGKTVICNREIPGITGGAINSKEGEPGPLLIQGDHGPIEYRNIVITPAN